MSYLNDKEQMNEEMEARKNKVKFIIKITFIAFAVALAAFAVSFMISLFSDGLFPSAKDTTPPVIQPREGTIVEGFLGEAPTFKKYVVVSDDQDDAPELKIVSDGVDIHNEGSYEVKYLARDKSGNTSKVLTITYVVKNRQYSKDKLMPMIEQLANDLGITKSMSTVEKVKAIYNFVNQQIKWSGGIGESNIPNINRNNWKTDWTEEAIRTIELYNAESCKGDCYSYYSVSKAFFEYFGIKSVGIRRDMSLDEDKGTHFWQIVDIGDGTWYFYDGTRLAGSFNDGSRNACLITAEKLESYRTSSGEDYFYKISKVTQCLDFSSAGISSYPKVSNVPLN